MLNNIGLPGLILIGLVLWLVIWLVKPSKRKLDEAADQKRIADSLEQIAKSNDLIEYVGDRPGHDKRYSIDSSKIQNEIGWKPAYDFDSAITQTVDWYMKNKDWWEPLADEKMLHAQPWTLSW